MVEVHLTQVQVNQISGALWAIKDVLDDLLNVFSLWFLASCVKWLFTGGTEKGR